MKALWFSTVQRISFPYQGYVYQLTLKNNEEVTLENINFNLYKLTRGVNINVNRACPELLIYMFVLIT